MSNIVKTKNGRWRANTQAESFPPPKFCRHAGDQTRLQGQWRSPRLTTNNLSRLTGVPKVIFGRPGTKELAKQNRVILTTGNAFPCRDRPAHFQKFVLIKTESISRKLNSESHQSIRSARGRGG